MRDKVLALNHFFFILNRFFFILSLRRPQPLLLHPQPQATSALNLWDVELQVVAAAALRSHEKGVRHHLLDNSFLLHHLPLLKKVIWSTNFICLLVDLLPISFVFCHHLRIFIIMILILDTSYLTILVSQLILVSGLFWIVCFWVVSRFPNHHPPLLITLHCQDLLLRA